MLSEGDWLYVDVRPREVVSSGFAQLTATYSLAEPAGETLVIGPFYSGELKLEAGVYESKFHVLGKELKPGENRFDVSLGSLKASCAVGLITADQEALALIEKQEARLPGLKADLEGARGDGVPIHYPQADLTIAELFCQYCRDDVAHGRYKRALQVAKEVGGLLDRARAEMRQGVEVPVVKVGTTEIRDGNLWGRCVVGDREEERPSS